jgi:membrane-bound lytic murein transglycosylase B
MSFRIPRPSPLLLCALALSFLPSTDAEGARRSKHRKAAVSGHAADVVTYGRRDDVMRFAAEVAEARQLDRAWVEATLAKARYQPAVARAIMPPPAGVAKNWQAYRARFVEPIRIRAGVDFWNANAAWLEAAEREYGVPPEIVVGIIGVETIFGRMTGEFRVLDALATLSFDFPSGRKDRSAFFRDELAQFLVLAQRERQAPEAIKGSYAGAIGLGQFMPSSIIKHAVDFDRDGRIDMAQDSADVIGSVAHYLAEFGWQKGLPTHYVIQPPVDTSERAALLVPDIVPSFTAAQMAEHGAVLDDAGAKHEGLLALVELQNGDAAPSHVAGTQNFYVVTRYNWSAYYALAVIELGQAIKAARTPRS